MRVLVVVGDQDMASSRRRLLGWTWAMIEKNARRRAA